MVKKIIYKGHVKKSLQKVSLLKKVLYLPPPPKNNPTKIFKLAFLNKKVLYPPPIQYIQVSFKYPRTTIKLSCKNPMIMN